MIYFTIIVIYRFTWFSSIFPCASAKSFNTFSCNTCNFDFNSSSVCNSSKCIESNLGFCTLSACRKS